MFTDGPTTPVRLEVMLDLLVKYPKGLKRDVIYDLVQPKTLSGGNQNTAKDTLGALLQLELVEEGNRLIKISKNYNSKKSIRENILRTLDEKILSSLDVELYLALYYAYYLGLDKAVYQRSNFKRNDWVDKFNEDVFSNKILPNRFNETKHTGLDRWLSYLGLGWYDSMEQFQANPYERLLRIIPVLFNGKSKMRDDKFMERLTQFCPELDGGEIFLQANKYRGYRIEDKQCSLGLSHALIDLHEDAIIRLNCPVDSRGWNIGIAQPPRDDTIKSDRITLIEYLGS